MFKEESLSFPSLAAIHKKVKVFTMHQDPLSLGQSCHDATKRQSLCCATSLGKLGSKLLHFVNGLKLASVSSDLQWLFKHELFDQSFTCV